MNEIREDIVWLLIRIKNCVDECKLRKWASSKKYIFRGSYDVWETKDDGVKFDTIMNTRLNEAMDLGLIVNESGNKEWEYNENWNLTCLGEKCLDKINLSEFRLKR